jgi:hypothetical protein
MPGPGVKCSFRALDSIAVMVSPDVSHLLREWEALGILNADFHHRFQIKSVSPKPLDVLRVRR